ncbi:MAG TPA: 5-guanidino-2-oxopentanoate decarboxylase [Dongiaceae bacterium]|jgi:5-guanidino-2-oxopentanoate decarboxylase|nr:5-guanidino-2-oxopentanoate decarboxylase [Dongiaceae bacterium]
MDSLGINQNCGQSAIAFLEASGVDTVFGIPGVHTLDFYKGLAQSRIRHIGVRHEQGAGFMADGYARASGKPGVCVLITGPGVVNAGTAIGQAFSDSVPMLVLSSVNAREDLGKGRGRLHEITDQQAVMAPLTAFSRTIMDPRELAGAMADAYAVFEAARPRPVHIEIPLDVLAGPGVAAADSRGRRRRPDPEPAALAAAAALIDSAERLVVIAGGGTLDAGPALRRFIERSGALLIPTTAAKGNVPDDHPQSLGSTLPLPATREVLAEADVVLAIGTELAETDHWTDRLPIRGKLIRVDLDPRVLVCDYAPDIAILADAGTVLTALGDRIGARQADLARVARARAAHAASWGPLARKHAAVLDALRAVLPDDGIVVSDMTQIAYTGATYFVCRRPRSWFHPQGFGTLGYALPAAMGAKLAAPARAVVAIAGDAGFLFTMQELATAVELELALPILLWNNDALGQIAGDMRGRGIPEIAVKPRNPDFQDLARAFHCRACRPESMEALKTALSESFRAAGPTLIEVHQTAALLD